jgi:hypothetical protein
MKREYERLELELTAFDSASDVVRTSIGTGRFDEDWNAVNPNGNDTTFGEGTK